MVGRGRSVSRYGILALICIVMTLAASGLTSANPGGFYVGIEWLVLVAIVLFITNYPINLAILLWHTFVALKARGPRFVSNLGESTLLKRIAAGTIVVSLIGGLIDGYLLFDDSSRISDDWMFWVRSLAAIFISILLALYFISDTELKFAFLAACGLTAMNPIAWMLIRFTQGENSVLGLDPFGGLLVIDMIAVFSCIVLWIANARVIKGKTVPLSSAVATDD